MRRTPILGGGWRGTGVNNMSIYKKNSMVMPMGSDIGCRTILPCIGDGQYVVTSNCIMLLIKPCVMIYDGSWRFETNFWLFNRLLWISIDCKYCATIVRT